MTDYVEAAKDKHDQVYAAALCRRIQELLTRHFNDSVKNMDIETLELELLATRGFIEGRGEDGEV
jgi:hypothetical protein